MEYDGKNFIKSINNDLTCPLEEFKMTFQQLQKFIVNITKNIVLDFLIEYKKQGCYFYPPFYEKYIKNELENLSKNAFNFLFYEFNDNYVILNGFNKICPVSKDTGITELNQVFSNAINLFLSLKHKLNLKEESLSPNFLTYASMFKMFTSNTQNNLYGVTGTIGEKNDAQRFLKNFYNVDIVFSPSFNKNLSISYPPILVNNEQEWINQIIEVVNKEAKKGRGILIINEGIKISEKIYKEIENKKSNYLIKLKKYIRSDFQYQKINVDEILKEGEVIITTNLGEEELILKYLKMLKKMEECILF